MDTPKEALCRSLHKVHKVRNVLNALPKSVHAGARRALNEIILAEDRTHAERAIEAFASDYGVKWPKAVAKVTDDQDALLTFFDYPAEHWQHLRTTNPIESSFSPVRARTRVTKGPGTRDMGLAMVFKLLQAAQGRWRAVNGPHLVALVRAGARFEKGKLIERPDQTPDKEAGEGVDMVAAGCASALRRPAPPACNPLWSARSGKRAPRLTASRQPAADFGDNSTHGTHMVRNHQIVKFCRSPVNAWSRGDPVDSLGGLRQLAHSARMFRRLARASSIIVPTPPSSTILLLARAKPLTSAAVMWGGRDSASGSVTTSTR